jgi:hypothetical protein
MHRIVDEPDADYWGSVARQVMHRTVDVGIPDEYFMIEATRNEQDQILVEVESYNSLSVIVLVLTLFLVLDGVPENDFTV